MQATLQRPTATPTSSVAATVMLDNRSSSTAFSVIPTELIESFLIFGNVFIFQLHASTAVHEIDRYFGINCDKDYAEKDWASNLAWYDLIGDYLSKS